MGCNWAFKSPSYFLPVPKEISLDDVVRPDGGGQNSGSVRAGWGIGEMNFVGRIGSVFHYGRHVPFVGRLGLLPSEAIL